jgi:drug/metabolite transporter (DMT)-like permease
MSAFALALVLAGAVCHATWNYIMKKAGGGFPFFFLFCTVSVLLLAPFALALLWWQRPAIGAAGFVAIAAAAVLHAAYTFALDRGYRHGDLSIVYPLARGTGPLLTLAGAVVLLGERPSWLAVGGAVAIALGVVLLLGDPRQLFRVPPQGNGRSAAPGRGIAFALVTGALIAAYTLNDKRAVATLLIPPLLFDWAANLGRTALMAPFAWRYRTAVRLAWVRYRKAVIAVAILSPLSYILALTAMQFTPVSYVAPAREVSILFATFLGARFLAEGQFRQRLAAAALMVAGLAALALG